MAEPRPTLRVVKPPLWGKAMWKASHRVHQRLAMNLGITAWHRVTSPVERAIWRTHNQIVIASENAAGLFAPAGGR